ncbi:MAG: hypothetical protein GX838_01585 [Clostridiaceae bacterium]|nr:hypothetical protein [Clostridiaceae bacterium]
MFGYVRPEKPDLLIRDFTVYKAVYCGLCKSIGRRCGQIPRAAVTYDMTFLSLLLLALSPERITLNQESCVLNPFRKKPVAGSDPVLEFAADLSCLLAFYSAKDDAADDRPVRGRIATLLFSRSAGKVMRRYPELNAWIKEKLVRLNQLEKGDSIDETAACFGAILKRILLEGFALVQREDDEVTALLLGEAAEALGRWVYLLDAIDDLELDGQKGNTNHFLALPKDEALLSAETKLIEAEAAVDSNLALLTYEQWGGLVYNIVTIGLPATRQRILAGEQLPAL